MQLSSYFVRVFVACLPALVFTGCTGSATVAGSSSDSLQGTGVAIKGRVHGGQQVIALAHVYLFQANTTGYGGPGIAPSASNKSVSLLSAGSTGNSDSVGAYVLTDAGGNFSITGDYSCMPNTQVYLYALGGNPGLSSGTNNTAAGLLAILGNCPTGGNFLSATPYVVINEVSTIAAAYSFAGFASDATHVSSSGTALAQTGIANAFAVAANLENLSTGVSLSSTPAGNGMVPQSTINTLANILAACVNTAGPTGSANPTACDTLLNTALSGGSSGAVPSDTASAAINIAHNPGANIAALYGLPTGQPAFAPALSTQPNDFSIGVAFTGGGLSSPNSIAIDASGNAWVGNSPVSIIKLSSSGAVLSGAGGFTGGGLDEPQGIAIDGSGNAWVADYAGRVVEMSNAGSILSGSNGFTGGALATSRWIAVDGFGNVWVANYQSTAVTKLSSSGSILSGTNGFTGAGLIDPQGIAIDGSGNAWVPCGPNNNVTEFSNSGSILSGTNGFWGGGIYNPFGIAVDGSGNAWIANSYGENVTELSGSGSILSGASGYSLGGVYDPNSIAIDGAGNAWIASKFTSNVNSGNGNVVEISNAGATLSGANGLIGGGVDYPVGIAIDGSGDVWVVNGSGSRVTELIGAATPVITPIAAGLPATPTANGTSKLGTRP